MKKSTVIPLLGMTVIRLLPPLTIGYDELDFMEEKLKEVLGKRS